MTICDIFMIIIEMLDKNTNEDVKGLYNISMTSKEMNTIVKSNNDIKVLKMLAKFHNLCEAICDIINNAINDNIIDVINIDYIIPYLTIQDLIDINVYICILFLDWDDTLIPHKYRDRCLIEGKILNEFIKKASKNTYKLSLILPYSMINDKEYNYTNDHFNDWIEML